MTTTGDGRRQSKTGHRDGYEDRRVTVDCLDTSFARSGVPHSRRELVAITSDEATAWECRFFNHGQAVADYLAVTFAESVWTENLALRRAAQSGQQQVRDPRRAGHPGAEQDRRPGGSS
jgi:hypothetical protein